MGTRGYGKWVKRGERILIVESIVALEKEPKGFKSNWQKQETERISLPLGG